MANHPQSTSPPSGRRISAAPGEFLWFAAVLIVLLASVAARAPSPDTASATVAAPAP